MKSVIFAVLLVAVLAEPEIKMDGGKFSYSTGDDGGHKREETIAADGSVSGYYSYVDPNGDLRTVNYKAGAGGFEPSGDITVDQKTAAAALELQKLAPKVPEADVKVPASPFTIPAPLYAPGILAAPGLLHAPLPLAYNLPLLHNTLPGGIIGHRLIL